MNKIKVSRKILLTLALVMILTIMGAFCSLNKNNKPTSAEAVYNNYGLKVEDTANVRTTVNSMGIRFIGSISSEKATDVLSINNGVVTLNDGARIGMIIAPEKAFDENHELVASHRTAQGQINYYTLINEAYGMLVSNYAVEFGNNQITVNNDNSVTVKGAIVNIRDNNLKYNYKSVLYIVVGGEYYYSNVVSNGFKIKDMADEFLRSNYEIDEDVKPGLKQIVAKSVAMEFNGSTDGIVTNGDGSISLNVSASSGVTVGQTVNVDSLVTMGAGDTARVISSSGKVTDAGNNSVRVSGNGTCNVLLETPYGINYTYLFDIDGVLNILAGNLSDYKIISTVGYGSDYTEDNNNNTTWDTYKNDGLSEVFQKALKKVTGYTMELLTTEREDAQYLPSAYSASDKYIVIGNNTYVDQAFADVDNYEYYTDNYNYISYKIIVKDNSIFVQASDSALRFAIYGLLNSLVGYDQIATDAYIYGDSGNIINEEYYHEYDGSGNLSLTIDQIEKEFVSDIGYSIGGSSGTLYNVDLGQGVHSNASMGYTRLSDGSWGYGFHTAFDWLPVDTYYSSNPSWYVLSGGSPAQVCYYALRTSPTALNVIIDKLNAIKENAVGRTVQFSDMDTGVSCSCSNCKDNLGYQYFMFLNTVYDKMVENGLNNYMRFEGMVYNEMQMQPPVDANGDARVVLNENISCYLALNYSDWYAGFSEIDLENLAKWYKCGSNYKYWTYNVRSSQEMLFFDDFTNKQKLYETLAGLGTEAIFEEGMSGYVAGTNFNNLRVYLSGKLAQVSGLGMTDEEADDYYNGLINHFFNEYFDVAAEPMKAIFDAQRGRAQYSYENYVEGDNIYERAYSNTGMSNGQETPYRENGNLLVGNQSPYAFHFWVGNDMHGNRTALSLVYTRAHLMSMCENLKQAKSTVNSSPLSAERKAELIKRIEVEEVAIIYQYMFIYEDSFSTGGGYRNNSNISSLTADDLQALGVTTVKDGMQRFLNLCDAFNIKHVNGYGVTTEKLTAWWNLSDGVIGDDGEW